MSTGAAQQGIRRARRHFFDSGVIEPGLVREVIARSWVRCAQVPLDESREPRFDPVDRIDMREALQDNDELLCHAMPEIERLNRHVSDAGAVLMLADPAGLILNATGDFGFMERAQKVALMPGVAWSEPQQGTNAIGTALAEGVPCLVQGVEHYLHSHGFLSCAAAPVLAPDGQLAGVLDVSGSARSEHHYAMGMVELAVEEIERRWFESFAKDRVVLAFHRRFELLGTAQEGLIAIDDERIVGANQHASRILRLSRPELIGAGFSHLFGVTLDRWLSRNMAPRASTTNLVTRNGSPLCAAARGAAYRTRVFRVPANLQSRTRQRRENREDPRLAEQFTRALRVLNAGLCVVIVGETGTGKEHFARRLHAASARGGGPFVALNCAAIPESLIESELFGYQEGAFTGALKQGMPGRLREADGGTLFLDEIGDMPLALQARLLRVLQDKQVCPLGGGMPVAVDFCVVCATHRDLRTLSAAGQFRQDLLYRLNHFRVRMPALRERSDVERLAHQMLDRFGAQKEVREFSPALREWLLRHPWPGNIRQLENLIKTLCALAEGETLDIDLLPDDSQAHATGATTGSSTGTRRLQEVERKLIQDTLAACGQRAEVAARVLGISRATIYRRMRALKNERR